MKRKRGSTKRKPSKKPQAAIADTEHADSAFLNTEYSLHGRDKNDGFDSTMEAETPNAGTTASCHHAELQEEGFLGVTNTGSLINNSNLLKNVASFAATRSRTVGSSSIKSNDDALPFQGGKMREREPGVPHLDPQCDEQELNTAILVIKKIMKMESAKPFNVPVDPTALGIQDYFDIIDSPMDFGTICKNLELGRKYRNSKDVYKDVQLIWDNCCKYNKKGDYILDLMKRVKIIFTKHWNAAGLFRQEQEVDDETIIYHAAKFLTRQNKDGNVFPSVSMNSKSTHQERQDFAALCESQREKCLSCFIPSRSWHINSQCQCELQSMQIQSVHSHCSVHVATPESTMGQNLQTHLCRGSPVTVKHYSQQKDEIRPQQELYHQSPCCGPECHPKGRPCNFQSCCSHSSTTLAGMNTRGGSVTGKLNSLLQDEIRPQQEFSHQPQANCGPQCRLKEKPCNYQSGPSHLSTIQAGINTQSEGHLPSHGVSISSTCQNCEHACNLVPMSCHTNNYKHRQRCSRHVHAGKSLLRCTDQYQSHQKSRQLLSNSSEMLNSEGNVVVCAKEVNPHVHSPVGSTARHTKGRPIDPSSLASDCCSHQLQIGLNQVQRSPVIYTNLYQPREKSRQCQFGVGVAEPQLSSGGAVVVGAAHAESTVRHSKCQLADSGSPYSDDCSDQEESQMGPRESKSPSLRPSDQPKENDPRCQPISSSPEPSSPLEPSATVEKVLVPPYDDSLFQINSAGLERKSRVRGPTRCLKLLEEGKRISITTDELGQPVGLEAPKLISFLGTLARNGHMAPLTFVDWRNMPEEKKENLWEEVQMKFEIDPRSKSWVIKSLSRKWKDWKSKLKTAHYITHATDEERLADRDDRVLADQWAYLVSHWSSEEAEKQSARNKVNRSKVKFGHITGTKSFARIREEQRVKRSDGKAPSRAELFILTRTRKDGKPINEASSAVITQLNEIANRPNNTSKDSAPGDEVFSQLIGRDNHGRVRCNELRPSPSESGGANPSKAAATKTVSEANSEVREMKEKLVLMEQTCAQMAQQMAAMMSMMSSMQKDS